MFSLAPAATGPGLGRALPTWITAFKALYRGEPGEASDILRDSEARTGNKHAMWIASALVNGALGALVAGIFVSKTNDSLSAWSFAEKPNEMQYMFIVLLASFVYLVARAGSIVATTARRGKRASFLEAAGLASVGFVAAAPLFVAFLLALVAPSDITLIIVILTWVFVAFFGETATYIAIARHGRFAKSAVLPHSIFSALWLVATTWVAWSLFSDAFGALFGSALFGSVL